VSSRLLLSPSVKIAKHGEMTEWLKVPLSKSGVLAMVPRVRIPLSPPKKLFYAFDRRDHSTLLFTQDGGDIVEDSIFSKIVRKEIPAHRIYEDDAVLAFLDIHPAQPGHVLVIPKRQVEFVWDLSDSDYAAVMAVAKRIALRLREVLDVKYVGERIVGVDVPHAHVQLIPFNTADEFKAPPDMESEPDHAALAEMAEKIHVSAIG
jgi:histidine triad (HIT) family protein